jgi:hypothetical protein
MLVRLPRASRSWFLAASLTVVARAQAQEPAFQWNIPVPFPKPPVPPDNPMGTVAA